MFHCPSCGDSFPENERYTYYLSNPRTDRQFTKPQYACGRCVVQKDLSVDREREPVPVAFQEAFGGLPLWYVCSAPKGRF